MTEIDLITWENPLWEEIISFAEGCSWKAGPVLAEQMRRRQFHGWERVCAACVDGKPAGFCTFAAKDELPEQYDFTPFIGFMFVGEPYRGRRLSERMIEAVISYARELEYGKIYVMSGENGLYEKFGFEKIGAYRTIYGWVDQLFVRSI